MNFKKRVNGSWTDTPHYIHNTSTDTITTLPAVIYPTSTTVTVGLKGQTLQSSIPSPTSPVMPQGTGERTGNLYNKNATEWTLGILDDNGQPTGSTSSHYTTNYTAVLPQTAYLLSGTISTTGSLRVYFYSGDKSWISRTSQKTTGDFTTPQNCFYIRIQVTVTIDDTSDWMLNTGSTALPYEPYGIKIPISSASTTTPVYLGEVQTTRKIKKYEFTGLESFVAVGSGYVVNIQDAIGVEQRAVTDAICSHYQAQSYSTVYGGTRFGFAQRLGASETTRGFSFSKGEIETAQDFKTYLAQQYAAGTPVTVWYVLATPTTGVVNEPLRKIGDYADEVSGITIPTIAGADSFDVLTTLKPSEVELTYTGWHDATVKEWDGSEWQ